MEWEIAKPSYEKAGTQKNLVSYKPNPYRFVGRHNLFFLQNSVIFAAQNKTNRPQTIYL